MDIGHENSQADDHNTNQNEATLVCRSSHGTEGLSQRPVILEKIDNRESGPTALDQVDSPDNVNTGMCNAVNTLIIPPSTDVGSTELAVAIEPQTDLRNDYDEYESGNGQNCSLCDQTQDGTLSIVTDSCPTTPQDRKTENSTNASNAVSPNDSSTVDISVTSDDNIQVICRCSSTPVNYSVHNGLNDTDDVGDASPISSSETKSKTDTDLHACNDNLPKDDVKTSTKDDDKTDGSMMFITPQMNPNKPHESRNPQQEHEYSPRSNPYYIDRYQSPGFQQNYPNNSLRPFSASPYDYPPYNVSETPYGYNDYHPYGQRSMTDMKPRHGMQQMNISPQPDLCCYSAPQNGMSDRDYFVYPSIYVSNAGLISVLLRNDMSVEMTVDRTIRVVSHNHMMAVATDSKGTAASLYHPAVKIFQMGYNTDIATDMFRAKMSQGEAIFFSNGINCFKLQESELQPMTPIKFSDIQRDQSVNLLFSSEGYGESLVATCMQVAAQAEYANLPKGGVIVRINGVKVTQSGCGDVTVVTGAKFIRLSPYNGTTRLGNRFVDIEVERDWSVKLTRGTHSFVNTKKRTMVSNGKMEAGFDENNGLKVINLQSRHPLLAEPNIIRRPGKRMVRTPPTNTSACFTPRRRVMASGGGRGGVNTC